MSNSTAALAILAPHSSESIEGVQAFLEQSQRSLNQNDFLAVDFDMKNEQDAQVFNALTENKEAFNAWRQNMARASMHMELSDFEPLFEQHRASLLDLAAEMNIPAKVNAISFDALLSKVDAEVSLRERRSPKGAAAFVEARVTVAALHQNKHLFQSRTTLHALVVQDAITFGLINNLKRAYDWVVDLIKEKKCELCQKAVVQILKSSCDLAGTYICTAIVTAFTGVTSFIAAKFFCGFPIYLNKLFGNWCYKAVSHIQTRIKLTPECICSFNVPSLTLPKAEVQAAPGEPVMTVASAEVPVGTVCAVASGQCILDTDAAKAEYDAMQADLARRAEIEIAAIREMSKAEKIAYHSQILNGTVTTTLSSTQVNKELNKITKLTPQDGIISTVSAFFRRIFDAFRGKEKEVSKPVEAPTPARPSQITDFESFPTVAASITKVAGKANANMPMVASKAPVAAAKPTATSKTATAASKSATTASKTASKTTASTTKKTTTPIKTANKTATATADKSKLAPVKF